MTDPKLMSIKSEWLESVPQPEPPKRAVRLLRECDGVQSAATTEDVAKALGISLSDAMCLLKHGSINDAWLAAQQEAKIWSMQGQSVTGQGLGLCYK